MAPGQEPGAAGVGVREGHSFQWQSRPEALMGLLCQLVQSFPVLNLVKVVTPDTAASKFLPFEIMSTKCAAS